MPHFAGTTPDTLLLLGGGVITAGPLMTYANGAKLLRLSNIAILQYIAFPLIWAALVLYSVSRLRQLKRHA